MLQVNEEKKLSERQNYYRKTVRYSEQRDINQIHLKLMFQGDGKTIRNSKDSAVFEIQSFFYISTCRSSRTK